MNASAGTDFVPSLYCHSIISVNNTKYLLPQNHSISFKVPECSPAGCVIVQQNSQASTTMPAALIYAVSNRCFFAVGRSALMFRRANIAPPRAPMKMESVCMLIVISEP
ncbi:MAG: hypothetical protein UZ06_CHB003000148 [Chlorobi bacterium OLB6]|nr:MAG: hypothetical protein UZ06_CHB003000148 [Chlorobi bacterium OLB6]